MGNFASEIESGAWGNNALPEAVVNAWPYISGAGASRENTDRTIAANRQAAELEWQRNLEMWTRQNQYNAPEAQMERFRQAGLNPNLVYGQGAGGASGNATTLPKYNAPQAQYNYQPLGMPIFGLLNQYQDFVQKSAQTNNLIEQNKAIRAESEMKQRWNDMQRDNPNLFFKYMLENRVREQDWKYNLGQQKFMQGKEIWEKVTEPSLSYQLSFNKKRVDRIDEELARIKANTKYLNESADLKVKDNQYYQLKMWSQIINQGLGTISKFLPTNWLSGLGGRKTETFGNQQGNWSNPINTTPGGTFNRRRASRGAYNP